MRMGVYRSRTVERASKRLRWEITAARDIVVALVVVFGLVALIGVGQYAYQYYNENKTATVQEVHSGGTDITGSYYKLYMNDGTVWLVHSEFSVIARDKIRYKHEGDISKPGLDGLDFCYLTNVTRGSEIAAQRIESPVKATNCPAN